MTKDKEVGPNYFKDKGHIVTLGSYDDQESDLPLKDWITLYALKTGVKLNPGTIRKRRVISGLGRLVPPKTYLLSRDEFETVMATPLPFCSNVVRG